MTIPAALGTPTITGTLNGTKAVITWKAVTGAAKYEVWRATSANGTYSFKVDADDKVFFDYVGDYCSCKTVENLAELEQLKESLIQKKYLYIDNLKIDKDTGEVLS